MNILSMEHIVKSYTERKLFDDTSFFLQEGEKIGLIGVNGTGKTTLLRMMAGVEEPEKGKITFANHVVCRFLPQHPEFPAGKSVLESVKDMTSSDDVGEHDIKIMLTRLGITEWEQEVSELSGGQKKRLALAAVLLVPCEILVLDEPTNHLDTGMTEWLEEYLKKWKGSLIMVTHDRYFLDCVTNRIVEIDKGKLYSYDTNYSGFLERKAEREETLLRQDQKRKSLLRTELAWVRRGAQARSTKQKARLERFEELKEQQGYQENERMSIGSIATRLGRTILEIKDLGMLFGERALFRGFSYAVEKGDHIAFHGRNGSGKTTMLKLLAGYYKPTEGTIERGQTVKIGYYAQEAEEGFPNPKQRVIDYVKDVAEYLDTPDGKVTASKMLETFLFPGDMQYAPVEKLSGGEKRRLNLLRILMDAPNVLLLDEPTNDLDIATLTVLEDFLDHFDGVVIVVSHDRYFLDRTVRRIFAFEEDGIIRRYDGGFTDYAGKSRWFLQQKNEGVAGKEAENTGAVTDSRATWKHEKKLKFTYQEQKDYETIEAQIQELEEKIEQFEQQIAANARDFVKLNELTGQKEEAELLLEEKMNRWMYLEELAAKIKEQ